MKTEGIATTTHERLLRIRDDAVGYHGIIAIHSTKRGPAVGGTRFWRYRSEADAIHDALRLSAGMSYKNALADLPFGGGKSVIIDTSAPDRKAVFEAHARAVHALGGDYITAEDVGTSTTDMETMRAVTPYVAGLSTGAGDPSPFTARGTLRALQACLQFRFGSSDVGGRAIAIQGLGAVGYQLGRQLHELGARLIVADVVSERTSRAAAELSAKVVEPDAIYEAEADVFAPCALGAVINDLTLPRLACPIVVGAANNQLEQQRHGDLLELRGITYGPDYIANAGGVMSGATDILGWPIEESRRRIEGIYDTMLHVLELAREKQTSASAAADALARDRLG